MRAGSLRQLIYFQVNNQVSDGMGPGGIDVWEDSFAKRAAVWDLKAAERLKAMKTQHTITHRVRVRYDNRIKADMRIRWGTRYLEITAVTNPDGRKRMHEILAEEKSL